MKIMLLLICAVAVLATTGCVFWGGHGHDDNQDHRHDQRPIGVDHSEHPGDMDHRENLQP